MHPYYKERSSIACLAPGLCRSSSRTQVVSRPLRTAILGTDMGISVQHSQGSLAPAESAETPVKGNFDLLGSLETSAEEPSRQWCPSCPRPRFPQRVYQPAYCRRDRISKLPHDIQRISDYIGGRKRFCKGLPEQSSVLRTYLSGTDGGTDAFGIAVDSSQNIYVTGGARPRPSPRRTPTAPTHPAT